MRFLVTGVKGQLGFDVVRELHSRGFNDVLEYDIDLMDITNERQVEQAIVGNEVDVVIHCAAYTNVDEAECNEQLARKVNIYGTRNIAQMTELIGAKLIYISTDYVFDGTKPLFYLYNVDDKVNPKNIYGMTKYLGEEEVKYNPKHFIVRTSWLFGINGNNFVKDMLKISESKDEIDVLSYQFGSPTYTVDLAKILVDMSLTEKYGTYHANNSGFTNQAFFAEDIFEVNNIDIKVNHIKKNESNSNVKNSCLSKVSLDKAGFKRLPDYKDALVRYSIELKKQKENNKKLLLK